MNDTQGIVYVLSNRSLWLPERDYDDELLPIVKIGRTSPSTPYALKNRMSQLFKTGVVLPFDLEYAKAVDECDKVEANLHRIFANARVNPNREFFRVDVDAVVAALDPYNGEEVTLNGDELSDKITKVDIDARNQLEAVVHRRGWFSFNSVGIPVGAELVSTLDSSITAKVVSDTLIEYDEMHMSIGKAASEIRHKLTGDSRPVSGSAKWKYKGKILRLIKEEMQN